MKKTIAILTFLVMSFYSFAQTNILDAIGINDISLNTMLEYKNNQYLIREKTGAISAPFKSTQYSLFKYDKITHQAKDSILFAGDLIQTDSVVLGGTILMIANQDKINIVYQKVLNNEGGVLKGYYIQLDTNMNITIPEKLIEPLYNSRPFQHFVKRHDNSYLLSCLMRIPGTGGYFSKYVILDSIGNVTKADTFNNKPTIYDNTTNQAIIEVYPLSTNQYFVNGTNLVAGQVPQQTGYIADSNLNIIQPIPILKGVIPSNTIILPTGSIIGGGEYFLNQAFVLPILRKYNSGANFAITDSIRFSKIDSFDSYHSRANSLHSLTYNKFDNNIYFESISHKSILGECNIGINYSYIDIICVDTTLKIQWRKFIRIDHEGTNSCPYISNIILPDERSGVIIMGYRSLPDINKQFVYYITDTTVTQDPLPTAIKSPEMVSKDRINIYPQPAKDLINIEDKNGKLTHVQIYNPLGQLMLQQKLSGYHQKVYLNSLSSGVYFIVLELENNKKFFDKIIKY